VAQPGTRLITIFKNSDDLAAHAADFIVRATQDAIRTRGRAMLALAGGTTPERTYRLLTQPLRRSQIGWAHTFLFFTDERFAPIDDPASNFRMVQRALLAPVSVAQGHAFPIPTQLATATDAAAVYEATLADAFEIGDRRDHPPRFDLILLGLGEDGHTASLFPGAASLDVTDRWVVASPPGSLPPCLERITQTFPVLNAARDVLFLVSGSSKAEALRDVLDGRPAREQLPAARVHPVDGMVTWFVDEAAASRLTRSG
jgi:6-phosphogluconolactonase